MRRISTAGVALAAAMSLTLSGVTATAATNQESSQSKIDASAAQYSNYSSQLNGSAKSLPFNPLIIASIGVPFVVIMNILFNLLNAREYHTFFSGSAR